MKRQATHHSAGFSFVELTVALAIVGALSAIAVPNVLKSLPEKRLKSAARTLHADMQRARLQAVRQNGQSFLRFATDENYYYFDDNGDGEWNGEELKRELSQHGATTYGSGLAKTQPDGSELKFLALDVRFSNTGTAAVAGLLEEGDIPAMGPTIYLHNQNRDVCYAVNVNSLGAVKIWKFNGTSWEE